VTAHGQRIAVIVPVFDGASMLEACVDALLATGEADGSRPDVVLVDDGSRDASVAVARRIVAGSGGRVRLLELRRNHGYAAAIDHGVEHALRSEPSPDFLVFVNQDCIVLPGWLAPLVDALADPSVAAAGARLLEADGVTLQHAGAFVHANGLTEHHGRGNRDPNAWRRAADVEYVCGALFATTARAWRRFGPFDEGYAPAYFEEVDWCTRVREAGSRVRFVPASQARHLEASTSGKRSALYLRRYHRSRMRFVVRRHLRRGAFAWLRAEAAWLSSLRRWADVAPVLASYARLPSLLVELAVDMRRSRLPDAEYPGPATGSPGNLP
jgi:O-antigen biosynthesis protein